MKRKGNFEAFMRDLKRIVDDHSPYGSRYTNGPLDIEFFSFLDSKRQERRGVRVESGCDVNHGGRVSIEASPTGRVLTVTVSPEVTVHKEKR